MRNVNFKLLILISVLIPITGCTEVQKVYEGFSGITAEKRAEQERIAELKAAKEAKEKEYREYSENLMRIYRVKTYTLLRQAIQNDRDFSKTVYGRSTVSALDIKIQNFILENEIQEKVAKEEDRIKREVLSQYPNAESDFIINKIIQEKKALVRNNVRRLIKEDIELRLKDSTVLILFAGNFQQTNYPALEYEKIN